MVIEVLFFAQLAELFGATNRQIDGVDGLKDLIDRLEAEQVSFADQSYSIAVNEEMVDEDLSLSDGDVVAFLPAFAGG